MRTSKLFTQDHVNKVADLYIKKFTKKQISEAVGLAPHIVWYIVYSRLKINKQFPRHKRKEFAVRELDKQTINRIIVLTNFGYKGWEIAEDQRIPEALVSKVIENAREKKLIEKKV